MATTDILFGSWTLESFQRETPDGQADSVLGRRPAGLLVYTDGGVMSVHLAATEGAVSDAMAAYTAYYGTYSIDPVDAVVRHHVEAASVPGLAGTNQERRYRLGDDRLELSASVDGARTTLIWKRR